MKWACGSANSFLFTLEGLLIRKLSLLRARIRSLGRPTSQRPLKRAELLIQHGRRQQAYGGDGRRGPSTNCVSWSWWCVLKCPIKFISLFYTLSDFNFCLTKLLQNLIKLDGLPLTYVTRRPREHSPGRYAVRIIILSRSFCIVLSNPINALWTRYADAAIIRQGVEGDQGDGAYSAGVRHNPKFSIPYSPFPPTRSLLLIYTRLTHNDMLTRRCSVHLARRCGQHRRSRHQTQIPNTS